MNSALTNNRLEIEIVLQLLDLREVLYEAFDVWLAFFDHFGARLQVHALGCEPIAIFQKVF